MMAQTIYQNGKYRIVPIVCGFTVLGIDGRPIQRFETGEIEEAIATVDDMAYHDGVRGHVS